MIFKRSKQRGIQSKISAQLEQNIKTIYSIVLVFALSVLWMGCSSSDEVTDDEYLTETDEAAQTDSSITETPIVPEQEPEQVSKTAKTTQQFSVQADTVDIQPKRKQKVSVPSSIVVKSSAPKKFYTVEVGAFRLQSNVRRHQEQLTKRFNLPVIVLSDTLIHLTRVCVGNFSSKKSAGEFLLMMKTKYPKDYPDPWVSQLTK